VCDDRTLEKFIIIIIIIMYDILACIIVTHNPLCL